MIQTSSILLLLVSLSYASCKASTFIRINRSIEPLFVSSFVNFRIRTKTYFPSSFNFRPKRPFERKHAIIFKNFLSLHNESATTADKADSNVEEDISLPEMFFNRRERPKDITDKSFGPLLPIAKVVDDATGGWGLSYADLHPATPQTSAGQIFLATNFCYAAGGLALGVKGEWLLGALTEIAGIVSFWYHYSQLQLGKNRSEVRLALLIDYFTAGSALITGGFYMIQEGIETVPLEAILSAGAAIVCLTLCWVWEFGYPYIFWHSLWHILSAYTGYLIGNEHISKMT